MATHYPVNNVLQKRRQASASSFSPSLLSLLGLALARSLIRCPFSDLVSPIQTTIRYLCEWPAPNGSYCFYPDLPADQSRAGS